MMALDLWRTPILIAVHFNTLNNKLISSFLVRIRQSDAVASAPMAITKLRHSLNMATQSNLIGLDI